MLDQEYAYSHGDATYDYSYLWKGLKAILREHHPAPCRLFELGCGNGVTANFLVSLGYEVIGVDSSASGIEWARKTYSNVSFDVGSVYDALTAKHGHFPLVVSLETIEHLTQPRAFASTIFDLLEPGGIGIISTPYHGYMKNLALAITGKLDSHFTALWDGGHIKFFSIRTLSQLLQEGGFEILRFYRVGRIPMLAKSMFCVFKKPALTK
jgi:2-polyprenyl-3-methyl-5-hydroxy-6-metoxy-1,4-benzoquinol methylase